jgi:hypothetical protein
MRLLVLAMLLSATLAPSVLADVEWEEDGWLATIGLEHLEEGDEFGCYGMPNLAWGADPGAMSLECREYIENRIDASKWGVNPISTFTPDDLTVAQHSVIAGQGFMVHGDETGQSSTAWHSYDDVPSEDSDWYNLGRRGGSLEKEIADVDALSSELDAGGLVNMYWIGRVYDATVRHDGEVLDMLSERDDVWFTTWGEAYSYWATTKCDETYHNLENGTLTFEHSEVCQSAVPDAWNVPLTWIIKLQNGTVSGSGLAEISESESNSKEGWRVEDSVLYLSVLSGHNVSFTLSGNASYSIEGVSEFFNNKSSALTIAGHSTTDLFLWSKRFDGNEELRFTWLISPRSLDEGITWLPYLGLGVLVTSVSGIWLLLKKDAIQHSKAEALMDVSISGDDDE